MRRLLTWLAGGLGAAAVVRQLLRRHRQSVPAPAADPADELRAKLEQAREAPDDRDEFDAAEGTPVDAFESDESVERSRSLRERRRAVHEEGRAALERMRGADE